MVWIAPPEDPWESSNLEDERVWTACRTVEDAYSLPVSGAVLPDAVERLANRPFIQIPEDEAASMAGLDLDAGRSAAFEYFRREIAGMETERAAVYATRVGSWSKAQDLVLDEMKSILAGPRLAAFRPYLVRGLAARDSELRLDVCGRAIRGLLVSYDDAHPPWRHTAMVIFMEEEPTALLLRRGYSR